MGLSWAEINKIWGFHPGKGRVLPVLPLVTAFPSFIVGNHFNLSQCWFCPNSWWRWPFRVWIVLGWGYLCRCVMSTHDGTFVSLGQYLLSECDVTQMLRLTLP